MKKNLLFTSLFILFVGKSFAQAPVGLQDVIVEKYYISEQADEAANADGGILPAGSVTYRIYLDLAPSYRFQAVYGLENQELRIETTTSFFNNEDRGALFPTYTKTQARLNTVMLDSWLSAGAACVNNFGILKTEDDGVATVVNNYNPQVLQGTNPDAGIPISQQDGLLIVSGRTPSSAAQIGFTDQQIAIFDNTNLPANGNVFSSNNASWYSLEGGLGADTVDNKILIAQMTTNGIFKFKLNVQIRSLDGVVERYVAENPNSSTGDVVFPTLVYDSSVITNNESNVISSSGTVFKVYPNPCNNILNFELEKLKDGTAYSTLNIYSIDGKEVLSNEVKTNDNVYKEQIDISSIPSGIYFIKLNVENKIYTKKLLKL